MHSFSTDAETPFKYYAIYGGIGAAVVLIIGVVTICVVRFWRRYVSQDIVVLTFHEPF